MNQRLPASSTAAAEALDLATALRVFDETTATLAAHITRLEQTLVAKQAELTAANARLAAVMDGVAAGVVAIDREARVLMANPAACAIIAGLRPGADWRVLAPESPALRIVAGEPGPLRGERMHGGLILAARANALRDQQGGVSGAVEVFEDVTELRRLAEQAARVDRLQRLGEMAAGVAHEIRNPLNGIAGFASLLLADLPPGDRRRRYAEAIVAGVRDLDRTVSSLLEFTRPRRLDRRPQDPLALLQSVAALAAPDAEAAGVEIAVQGAWSGPMPACDGPQLKQVLLNLLRNAIEAIGETGRGRGRVVLAVARSAEGLEFIVDDDGPGVPEADRERIFSPFHTTKQQGTGLGLAVSQSIVQLHGGSIAVEDSPLGGARFRCVIPI